MVGGFVGVAVFEYARHGAVDWRAALVIALTMSIGAYGGAFVANKVNGATLKMLFGIFMLLLGACTVYGASKSNAAQARMDDKAALNTAPKLKPL